MQKLLAGLGLSCALTASVLSPATAQTVVPTMTCDAVISSRNGSSTSYQVTANLDRMQVLSDTLITVRQRDRNGNIRTLRHRAPLMALEEIAPDADYSRLPFTGSFRGTPNDGRRIYSMQGAVFGLHVSLRPTTGLPQQMQIVHYSSGSSFLRSAPVTCLLAQTLN